MGQNLKKSMNLIRMRTAFRYELAAHSVLVPEKKGQGPQTQHSKTKIYQNKMLYINKSTYQTEIQGCLYPCVSVSYAQ